MKYPFGGIATSASSLLSCNDFALTPPSFLTANFSVTELLNSPRIVQLKRKHWDEIETDASEMVWALFGSAVHNILEHGKDDHHIVEERIFTEHEGWKLSGAIDLQEVEGDGIIISDYKVTGAWSVMNEKQDWHNQLNIYGWLVEKVKKQPVKKLQIIAIVRDWSARDTVKEGYLIWCALGYFSICLAVEISRTVQMNALIDVLLSLLHRPQRDVNRGNRG